MKILRATHLGMCFGVRDAIDLALQSAQNRPLTVLGDLVHNPQVLEELRSKGIRIENDPTRIQTEQAMITAHGTSDAARARLKAMPWETLEATCPLVHYAHRSLRKLVEEGCHPVIIGKKGHVEVRGMTEDLAEFDVVLSEEEIASLKQRPLFGVVAQTTQPIDRVRHLVQCLRSRFPESAVRFSDTVCQPTKQRQQAAVDLAKESDVVIVVGGAHSNNTEELARTCRKQCDRVYKIQSVQELKPEWFERAEVVGITAGTSTPDRVIDGVESALRAMTRRMAAYVS